MKQLFILTCLVAALLTASVASAAPSGQTAVKVLFMVGGGSHDFTNLPPIMKKVLEDTGTFKVTITEDRNQLLSNNIARYDAVLIYTQGGELTPDQEKGLTEFVSGGKGFAGIHCASDSFTNSDAYWNMLGGRFTGHGYGDRPIRITGKSNSIVKGIENFNITDEDYDNKIHPDSKMLVLARWGNDSQPAVWVRDYGKGRVFYTGMGHGKEAFENKSFQEIVVRGLRWSCKMEPIVIQSTKTAPVENLLNGGKPFLACETYSIRDYIGGGKLSLEQVPALLKDLGIKGIVWNDIFFRSWDNSYLDTLKKAAADSGIITAGLIIEGNLATDDEAARKRQIEEDKMKLKAAAYMGCPVVRMNLGGAGSDEKDGTVGVARVTDAFNEMLPLAKQYNIKITIENHGGVSKTADWILAIIKGTDPKWIGSCLDFGNWPADIRYSETRKLAPHAYHVHAKTHEFDANGEDTGIDYNRVLGMMKVVGYNRAVSIEFEGSGDQVEGVKKTRDLVLKYWPELNQH